LLFLTYRLRFQVPSSQPTILRWFRNLREVIYQDIIKDLKPLSGEIEMDETMFGGRKPGKRGWGATGKWVVFGIYQRNGKVLTFPITSRAKETMQPYINRYTKAGSLYYTDDKVCLYHPTCPGKLCGGIKRERCSQRTGSYQWY